MASPHRKLHMLSQGIFATPPEPHFNLHPIGMKPEMLKEWLLVLAKENATAMKTASVKHGHFKQGKYAEFLFLTCEQLKLPHTAKYLAMELFDKFMTSHMVDLHNHVQAKNKRDWEPIRARVMNQVLLRIVTCCQLASKLTSHYRIVTPRKAQNVLRGFGHKYSSDSILQSELRILKTLNYKVMMVSPLIYIETLLEILGHNDATAEVKQYHGACLRNLDLLYIRWRSIYEGLYNMTTKNLSRPQTGSRNKDRAEFVAVEADCMLLAVSVITASSYVVDKSHTDKVIENLNKITNIPTDDILDLATLILQEAMSENEE